MPEAVFPRRLIYGEDSSEALVTLLNTLDTKKILIVTDEVIRKLEPFSNILKKLDEENIEYKIFDQTPQEPPLSIAEEIADMAIDAEVEAIVAIGGGSVIDASKAGLVKYVNKSMDIRDLSPFIPLGLELRKPYLIAVPTTSGTGSEATLGVVLTDEINGTKVKIALGSPEVVPYAAILDASFTRSMPQKLRISTGVDALAHAIEAYVSNQSNPLTDALAEKSIVMIIGNLEKALSGDDEAIHNMHMAATMAGMAFSNSGLGLAHAIAHPLGGILGTHHGLTVGIVLPYVVEYNTNKSPWIKEKYGKLLAIINALEGTAYPDLAELIKGFYKKIGQPLKFSEIGVEMEVYEKAKEIVPQLALQDADIAFAPVIPMPEDIKELLEKMY